MKKKGFLFSLFLSIFLFSMDASGAGTQVVEIKASGKQKIVTVKDVDEVIFYTSDSKKNSAQRIDVGIGAETDSKVTAQVLSGVITGRTSVRAAATKSKYWKPLSLKTTSTKKSNKTLVLKKNGSFNISNFKTDNISRVSASKGDPECGCLSEDEIQDILKKIKDGGVTGFTRKELCKRLASIPGICDVTENKPKDSPEPGDGVSPTGTSSATGYGLMERDKCSSSIRYAIAVKVNLRSIDWTQYPSGLKIGVILKAKAYSGNIRAALKPSSDGKFFPQPIMLMATTGYSFISGEYMRAVFFKRGRVSRTLKLNRGDYIYYRGTVFRREPVGKLMSGGRAVLEMVNNGNATAYGVCVSLNRRRQEFNGY